MCMNPVACLLMQSCSTPCEYNMHTSNRFTTPTTCLDFGLRVQRCTAAAAHGTSCCWNQVPYRSTLTALPLTAVVFTRYSNAQHA